MAATRLTDAIVPEVYYAYMLKETLDNAAVFRSGIVAEDAHIVSSLSGGGRVFQHPAWDDLNDNEPDIGTDNPADVSTPDKIGSRKAQFVRQVRTKSWSSAMLVQELAGDKPQDRIASRTGAWWARYFDRAAVSHLTGIVASNIANDNDMVLDISGNAGTVLIGGNTYPDYQMHGGAILEAKQTMGDDADVLKLIVMHSRVYTNLQHQQLITFIPNARGETTIPTYMGYEVLVTDNVPVTASGADFLYTTYLVGPGVLGFGESPVERPSETKSEPAQGMGMGVDTLYTRRQFAFWPRGWNWTDASCAGEFPTDAENEAADNWSRSWPERGMFPMAVIISKNG